MPNIFVYEVRAELSDDVGRYCYVDEALCRREAQARIDQGERVTVREYERVTGGFVTMCARQPTADESCVIGYDSLAEAHDAGERQVHGWAVVQSQATLVERHAEKVRMGWA